MASNSSLISPREAHLPVTQLFTRQDIIGKGAYGAVYKAVHNSSRTQVAIKIIELDSPESVDEDILEIQREVALLSSLRDAERNNCTSYHGSWLHSTQLWLAMDYAAGGSIRTIMKASSLEERFIAVIMRESLIALVYLHKQGIIHRDIKAANILLTSTGRIVLCDFGVAAHLQNGTNKRSTFIGTPYWMAPEVISDSKSYDTKADIWSLGVTMFECATGSPPYAQYEALRAIQLIPKNPPAKLDPNASWSTPMRDFLACCLNEDPKERLTAEDLLKTKWIKSHSKVHVSVLKELISRYDAWVSGGGIRSSIIGDDSQGGRADDTLQSEWDYDGSMGEDLDGAYGGTNLGSDGPVSNSPQKSIPQMGRARKPHALMQLFEEEDAPAPFINAAAAASAYGLGLGLNGSQGSADVSYAEPQQPQISIPSFDDDSDDDASGMTMRGNMSMASNSISEAPPTPTMPSAPTTFPPASLTAADPTAEDANTVRARPHMTHLSSSTSTGSSGSGTFGGGGDTGEAGGDSMTTSISTPSAMDTATAAGSPPQGDQSHTVGGRQRSDSEAMPPPPKPKLNTDVLHLRKGSSGVQQQSPKSTEPPAYTKPQLQPWTDGPAIRAFNYSELSSSPTGLHSQLDKTVQELSGWLTHLDGSFRNLLEATSA